VVSKAEVSDYKRGERDRKQGKKITPAPESDAYYRGVFGEPLDESKRGVKRAWGVAIGLALPLSYLAYWVSRHKPASLPPA
jgi:hypothetical protein